MNSLPFCAITFEHVFRDITLIVFCILATIVFVGTYFLNRLKERERDKDRQRDETSG